MAPKLIAAIVTFLLNAAAGFFVFFALLLALNGYSESDATYGIAVYIVLALIVSLAMGTLAALSTHVLVKRGWGTAGAVMLAVTAFSAAGAVLKVVCGFAGVLAAELVRANF